MEKSKLASILFAAIIFVLSGTAVAAQSVKIEGLIKARNGDNLTVKASDAREFTVRLTENTEVSQVQGMLKVRRKEMAMAALIPGLAIQLEGFYDSQNNVVAKSVKFKGDDLERAQAIEAGMHETKAQAEQNRQELEKQNAQLKEHKAAIDAAVARFGQLDDYYIFDELTIYFANGKSDVDPKYNSQLLALAEKAKSLEGYMVEVKGYTSSAGSTALNQQLSEDRADAVVAILLQQAHVPLTRMLSPGAMGESTQVGSGQTEQGQAENRRVVVRVLQNKAVAGA